MMRNVTVVCDTATCGPGAAMYYSGGGGYITRSIVAHNSGDGAFFCSDANPRMTWVITYENAGSDEVCGSGSEQNATFDPLFCDVENGDFRIDDRSFAASQNNPLGILFGALDPVDCDGITTKWIALVSGESLPETDHGLNNYPNPFNPRTTIGFSLEETFDAKLYVFNLSGALVRRIDLGVLPPGEHEAEWDGKDDSGSDVSSGVYFCRLGSDDKRQAAKMLLVR
jgi:hypothetical protein